MKNLVLIFLISSLMLACKNDKKTETQETVIESEDGITAKQKDGLTLLKGEFVYYADAAVLQTHAEVYAVVIDAKMHELDNLVKKYKQDATDMIPVEIRGKITPKPKDEEGWPYRVEIKEILNVYQPDPKDNNVIKLEN
ncbi:hypothetical protein RXV94_01775 [Yeosuana sp. MJ-SS3]|uniref:NlpE C-terminal OB domain-containing protein n=1 Tax=Gilvirhabdus luticola TaxID=3079858 RepID=A0ABU3U387_9FLAO|nr:hypothetical protein [Yeosuana sp. MJ-SS3]MDU8884870.1 hypothetical protein [Yeosuana sp. MJ-SS3]